MQTIFVSRVLKSSLWNMGKACSIYFVCIFWNDREYLKIKIYIKQMYSSYTLLPYGSLHRSHSTYFDYPYIYIQSNTNQILATIIKIKLDYTAFNISLSQHHFQSSYYHLLGSYIMLRHVTLNHVMSRYITSCHAMSCHVMSRHVTVRYITSCYFM